LSEFWVGKIRHIRIRGSASDPEVWVRVQWYWSPSEVATLIKSFDGSACGRRERLFSDHYDFVSSLCFSDITAVKKYREDDLEPEDISEIEFYMRYTLEHKVRKVDVSSGLDFHTPDHHADAPTFSPNPWALASAIDHTIQTMASCISALAQAAARHITELVLWTPKTRVSPIGLSVY